MKPRKQRVWKMWALMGHLSDVWAFDVYHTRAEARRVKGAGDKIIPVEVREVRRKK